MFPKYYYFIKNMKSVSKLNKLLSKRSLNVGGRLVDLSEPLIMGILNVTQDSFHDGGRFFDLKSALNKAETLLKEGADVIDVGGESTRPGASVIDTEEEIKRIKPIIQELSKNNIVLEKDMIISTGTCSKPIPIEAGDIVKANFGELGEISVNLI